MTDALADAWRQLSRGPVPPRDVAAAANAHGWLPDPETPWLPAARIDPASLMEGTLAPG